MVCDLVSVQLLAFSSQLEVVEAPQSLESSQFVSRDSKNLTDAKDLLVLTAERLGRKPSPYPLCIMPLSLL